MVAIAKAGAYLLYVTVKAIAPDAVIRQIANFYHLL